MERIEISFDERINPEDAIGYARTVIKVGRYERTRNVVTRFKDKTVVYAHLSRNNAICFKIERDDD